MTLEQAWTIVLDHYHDALPPDLQWRPGTFCRADKYWDRVYDDEDSYIGLKCLACGLINRDGVITHDIPAPALTDAAALAVLRALARQQDPLHLEFDFGQWYLRLTGDDQYRKDGGRLADDPRDAIILAAAELAQKEGK